MKRMLFNATHPEETRVGIIDGQKLIDIDIETIGREARKSNIYKGIVTRIEPSLEACFVNYGEERHGFLPFKEISRQYFKEGVDVRNTNIREAITEGQELVIQVEKEERGNKGAALTTFISLAGRYLVLMPNNPRGGGVSRRIEGEERQELRDAMEKLDLPSGMSTIARTAGIGRTVEELQWDLNYLLKLWTAISEASAPQYELIKNENGQVHTISVATPEVNGQKLKRINPPPFLIVEESNLVVRAIRDYFQPEIGEILVDTDEIYEQARQFMAHVMPDMVNRVKRYREDIPLFTRFQIEHQIETAYSRTVPLPSGGAIVIDHTEALVAIDVNSARATRGADIEETAFRTNCEAADEVARQMRLRDLGGLIVIDFIDMADLKNQRAVELRLKDALHYDRARVQMAKISRFGLMELSRQRLRPALSEGNHITCPRCNGVGVIRDTESCALQVLRILQEEAMKEGTGAVHAQVPVDVATFLLNEKRTDITKLEARHRVPIMLIPNTYLETPHYHIERLRQDDDRLEETVASFNRAEEFQPIVDDPYAQKSQDEKPAQTKQVPVIKNALPREPAPAHIEAENKAAQLTPVSEQKGLFARIAEFFFGKKEDAADETKKEEKTQERKPPRGGDRRKRRSNNNRKDRRSTDRNTDLDKSEEKLDEVTQEKRQSDKPERRSRRVKPVATAETVSTTPAAQEPEAEVAAVAEKPARRRRPRRKPVQETVQETALTTDIVTSETSTDIVETQPVVATTLAVPLNEEKTAVQTETSLEQIETKTATETADTEVVTDPALEETTDGETRRRRPRRRRRSKNAPETADSETALTETQEPQVLDAQTQTEQPLKQEAGVAFEKEVLIQIETKSPSEKEALVVETPIEAIPEKVETVELEKAVIETPHQAKESAPAIEPTTLEQAPETIEKTVAVSTKSVAQGLEENLAKAGLIQVHTHPDHVKVVAYEAVKYPGRATVSNTADTTDEPLEQVHTREDLVMNVSYEAVKFPGRPYVATPTTETQPLEQVHTKSAD